MKFDLTQPCVGCPFRTDCLEGWLGGPRIVEILDSITTHDAPFACHKTTEFDDDGDVIPSRKEQHCAGATILLERLDRPNMAMRFSKWAGLYDPTRLRMDSPVFRTPQAMIRHHIGSSRSKRGRKA